MLHRLFPTVIDARSRPNSAAFRLLIPVAAIKLLMGINAMVMTAYIATSADGIPVVSYGPAAGNAVLAFFSLWGLGQALLAAFGLLVALRYRAFIPLAFVMLSTEHFGRKALLALHPIARVLSDRSMIGPALNWELIIALLAGLVLSLAANDRAETHATSE